ncbi:hypothetical protein GCM10027289_15230 [Tsukamurella serpentis]
MYSKLSPVVRAVAVASTTAVIATVAPALAQAAPAPGDEATARRIACEEYSVGAATMDYRDTQSWRGRLTRGVTPELRAKLDSSYPSVAELLQPLKWVSTARLQGAEVKPAGNDIWNVTCFVAVRSTTVQAPQGREVLTQYEITLDKKRAWQITDIGGSGNPAR